MANDVIKMKGGVCVEMRIYDKCLGAIRLAQIRDARENDIIPQWFSATVLDYDSHPNSKGYISVA